MALIIQWISVYLFIWNIFLSCNFSKRPWSAWWWLSMFPTLKGPGQIFFICLVSYLHLSISRTFPSLNPNICMSSEASSLPPSSDGLIEGASETSDQSKTEKCKEKELHETTSIPRAFPTPLTSLSISNVVLALERAYQLLINSGGSNWLPMLLMAFA